MKQDDFKVLEEGKPQTISTFENNSDALSSAILLDTTGSNARGAPRVKNSVVKLIDELGPEDAIAIYTFDDHLTVRQDFSTDKEAIADSLRRLYLMSYQPGEVADGRWRKIDIAVSGNESCKLRAKQGYFPQ